MGGSLGALAQAIAAGKVSPSSVYLPNLALLDAGAHAPGQTVGVGYTANPAPMGIGDFGLGATPYAYNTSHFEGSLSLNAANATYPGAYYFMTPPAATDGSYNSPYYFGIQLNTVTNNISIPGNNRGAFWTQNVVTFNGNWITFEDNIWNFSSPSGALSPGTFYSYNGTPIYPTFYYDYGPSVPLAFPVTLNLYNNLTVVGNRDQMTFGYRVVDSAGSFNGVYDTVVFNNPNASTAGPAHSPEFQVSGKYTTPLGLDYDSELIFGGPGGGSNAVFNNISGTETLQYSNQTSGGWKSVPSAYDFGGDTGETAIGVAETWSPGGVVNLSAGPSLLYGLWNSQPSTRVPSGSIEFQGTISPSYGFGFIGISPAVNYYNTSYLPTNAAGSFLTYLPPGTYDAVFLADGYATASGTFSATTTGASVILTASPGTMAAPLYLDGNAQAQAAAANLVKWTSGVLNFTGLVPLNGTEALFFDRLNDWGYVSFNLFQATGVSDVINVTGMSQGASAYPANIYFMDGPANGTPPTLLGVAPQFTNSLPQYGELIAFYSDPHAQLYKQVLIGTFAGTNLTTGPQPYYALNPAGGAVVMWNTPGAVSNETMAAYGSYGVFLAGSPGVSVDHASALYGANAVTLAGSDGATVQNVAASLSVSWTNSEGTTNETTIAVLDEGSSGGQISSVSATYGAFGYYGYLSSKTTITNVTVEFGSTNISQIVLSTDVTGYAIGTLLYGTSGITVVNTTLLGGDTVGVLAEFATGTTVLTDTGTGLFSQATSLYLYGDSYTNVTDLNTTESLLGLFIEASGNTTITAASFFDMFLLGAGFYNDYTTINGLTASHIAVLGLILAGSANTVLTNVVSTFGSRDAIDAAGLTTTSIAGFTVNQGSFGAMIANSVDTTISSLSVDGTSEGVLLSATSSTTFSGVTATNASLGLVDRSGSNLVNATGLVADNSSEAALLYQTTNVTISGLTADVSSTGVRGTGLTSVSISGVSASGSSIGVDLSTSTEGSVSGVTASGSSLGVYLDSSSQFSVTNVVASGTTIGVWLYGGQLETVSGVTGTGNAPVAPDSLAYLWGVPLALVVTENTVSTTISGVNATSYPAALFDYSSVGLTFGNSNATDGYYGIQLNGTYNSYITGFSAYRDFQGLVTFDNAGGNTIVSNSFVDDTSYGVYLLTGYGNTLWNNNFIGDNGATSTYSPLHIQAWSYNYNDFYICTDAICSTGIGNYWADWHTYGPNGLLAPYVITGNNVDEFPIGPAETFSVTFTESGLAAGASWSVTFNGVTQNATTASISFGAPMGSFAYAIGNVAGYSANPASGNLQISGAAYSVPVTFTANTYAVTLSEGGLASGTAWSATVNGQTQSTSGSSLVFYLAEGSYAYSFGSVSGYNLGTNSSGTLTVSAAPLAVAASYSPTNTPSLASTSDLNTYFAVAIAIAIVALVVALLALFLRRRPKPSENPPPTAWTPPPSTNSPPSTGGSGANNWSEGPAGNSGSR